MNGTGSITHSSGMVATMQEQPAMAELATQNQALVQEVEVLKKQYAAMHLLFQQMAKQNELLAAANAGGSIIQLKGAELLGEKVSALTEANELLRLENTLLKAQQDEANAQHADEISQKNSHIAQLERGFTEQVVEKLAYREFFKKIKKVSESPLVMNHTQESFNRWSAQLSPAHQTAEEIRAWRATYEPYIPDAEAIRSAIVEFEKHELAALLKIANEGGD